MDKIINTSQFQEIENRIVNTVNQVNERGFNNNIEVFDDYSELIERAEFKNAIIVEIYENYFPPKRHEFELQLITDIVEAVINSKFALFKPVLVAVTRADDPVKSSTQPLLLEVLFNVPLALIAPPGTCSFSVGPLVPIQQDRKSVV